MVLTMSPLAGCGKKDAGAFDSASPQTKTLWAEATAAAQARDYTNAFAGFKKVLEDPQLSPKASEAARDAMSNLSEELTKAAAGGDQKAKQAVEDMAKMRRTR